MNIFAVVAFIVTISAWVLMGLTGVNVLSGEFEGRTCLTSCVQTYFFASVAAGIAGVLFSAVAMAKAKGRVLATISLLLALALCAIFVVLYVTGNFL